MVPPPIQGTSKEKKPTKKKEATDVSCLIFTLYILSCKVRTHIHPLSNFSFSQDAKPKTPESDATASKVAPAKKPKVKNAAGEGGPEPKPSKAKRASKASKEGAEEPAAKKGGKKTAAKAEEGESGERVAAKAPGKRGKK